MLPATLTGHPLTLPLINVYMQGRLVKTIIHMLIWDVKNYFT
ncbi:hypothetical protein vBLenPICBM1__58 [Lentibacter phage vB_LenP_ICBM1]|uniref:Uncharacterized protein n=1 Tax=Lentibacter phage vB_LenP_ICBM1 TaxID=2847822 RepID=A0A411MQS5_9CAUD|nr:hypothetical protein HWB27_gp58 [Lentibacter phage vB_LenP_ICBM1]QBF29176.1 hypothetical protein vBLenPICBM1__58 [Lentibacter phage vB_LenP_ICBM1]